MHKEANEWTVFLPNHTNRITSVSNEMHVFEKQRKYTHIFFFTLNGILNINRLFALQNKSFTEKKKKKICLAVFAWLIWSDMTTNDAVHVLCVCVGIIKYWWWRNDAGKRWMVRQNVVENMQCIISNQFSSSFIAFWVLCFELFVVVLFFFSLSRFFSFSCWFVCITSHSANLFSSCSNMKFMQTPIQIFKPCCVLCQPIPLRTRAREKSCHSKQK